MITDNKPVTTSTSINENACRVRANTTFRRSIEKSDFIAKRCKQRAASTKWNETYRSSRAEPLPDSQKRLCETPAVDYRCHERSPASGRAISLHGCSSVAVARCATHSSASKLLPETIRAH